MTEEKDEKKRERAAGLVLEAPDDGYTLKGVATSGDPRKPPLTFWYRPALPEQVFQYRMDLMDAAGGAGRWGVVARLLGAHVVRWDVTARTPSGAAQALPFTPQALTDPRVGRLLGVEYLDQMVNHVTGYSAGEWEADAKNS